MYITSKRGWCLADKSITKDWGHAHNIKYTVQTQFRERRDRLLHHGSLWPASVWFAVSPDQHISRFCPDRECLYGEPMSHAQASFDPIPWIVTWTGRLALWRPDRLINQPYFWSTWLSCWATRINLKEWWIARTFEKTDTYHDYRSLASHSNDRYHHDSIRTKRITYDKHVSQTSTYMSHLYYNEYNRYADQTSKPITTPYS